MLSRLFVGVYGLILEVSPGIVHVGAGRSAVLNYTVALTGGRLWNRNRKVSAGLLAFCDHKLAWSFDSFSIFAAL